MSVTHAAVKGSLEVLYASEWNAEHIGVFLDVALGDDHSAIGVKVEATAGEALVFGDNCYMKSDGKLWKSDADAASTMPIIAMAIESIDQNATGTFLLIGIARDDSYAWTTGAILYGHTTAGELTNVAPAGSGDQVQAVAVALPNDHIFFKPSMVLVERA